MSDLQIQINPKVELVFNKYSPTVHSRIMRLRALILETAKEIDSVESIEETLKWGEPSYLVKKGSTIRIDWKEKKPNQYAMYFKCTSKLVETFKIVYKDSFEFEDNRAIIFQLNDNIPEIELKKCIAVGLTYHKVKHLTLLGL